MLETIKENDKVKMHSVTMFAGNFRLKNVKTNFQVRKPHLLLPNHSLPDRFTTCNREVGYNENDIRDDVDNESIL